MSANQQLITEPGPVDQRAGTRRLDLWRQSSAGGQWGDLARGDGFSARYVSDDGHGCAEVDVYPIEADWGWDVCEQTTVGRAVYEDPVYEPACPDCGHPLTPDGDDWTCQHDACIRAVVAASEIEDQRDMTRPRPDDAAEITYEYPHALIISSLEEAQKLAEYYGRRDYSYALNLRAPTTTTGD